MRFEYYSSSNNFKKAEKVIGKMYWVNNARSLPKNKMIKTERTTEIVGPVLTLHGPAKNATYNGT